MLVVMAEPFEPVALVTRLAAMADAAAHSGRHHGHPMRA
jgi:hypothetical protein